MARRDKRPPHSNWPTVIIGAGLILLGLSAAFSLQQSRKQASSGRSEFCSQPRTVEFEAPILHLTDLKGQPVSLGDLRGTVVLLNTWASWCPPCRAEMPDLEAYFQEHKDEGFTLVGVNIGEGPGVVSEFASRVGITFPLWLDPTEQSLKAFRTISLPSSFVIDRQGTVRLAWSGATCLSQLEARVTPLLRQ